MVLNIFALILVLGITFMHSMFGLFSGILNVFCCIVAVAVAFGFGEPLTAWATGQFGLHPAYTEAFAYLLLFVVTHSGLRVAADTLLRGNVRVPMLADWIGGGIAGFVIAQLSIGMLVICFMMMPWGGRVMMHQPIERISGKGTLDDGTRDDLPPGELARFERNRMWLRSDDFTVGLARLLSGGALRGNTTLASVYPSFTEWVAWTANTVQPESTPSPYRDKKSGDGFKDGVAVQSWWKQTTPLAAEYTRYRGQAPTESVPQPPFAPFAYRPQAGYELLGVRLNLKPAAADRGKATVHLLRPTMIRVVGDIVQPDGSREPRQFVPQVMGGVTPALSDNLRVVDPDNNISLASNATIDAYFEVPADFQPRFIEYRRHARAELAAAQSADKPPTARLTAGETAGPTGAPTGPTFLRDAFDHERTGAVARLPFPLLMDRARGSGQIEIAGEVLVRGRLTGQMSAWSPPGTSPAGNVNALRPPEGSCIVQFALHMQQARSLPGQIMNFVTGTTNQYAAVDSVGEVYPLAGYYAMVPRDGDVYFELFYEPNPTDAGYNQMLNFSDTGVLRQLQRDDSAVLGLIFAVPKGTNIVAVNSRQREGRVEIGTTYTAQCD